VACASLLEQGLTILSLSAALVWVFPQTALAQGVRFQNTPRLAFEIKMEDLKNPSRQYSLSDAPDNKVRILKNYLEQKQSPLQDHVGTLLLQPNWKVIVSIAQAESNMCRRQLGNNCWGIGGARYHRYYPSFAQGIIDANDLIQKYHDSGLTTPKKMMTRWVGWNNQSWIQANNQVLAQIEGLGI
ncbi:MAG: hypothetical protein HY397_03660, partial [Candidatus Doudnabacteria bacterium]|nr:hypothetical protein [Candidatus Doudnabacteria bacterium]